MDFEQVERLEDSPFFQSLKPEIQQTIISVRAGLQRELTPEERAANDERAARQLEEKRKSLRSRYRQTCGYEGEMWTKTFDSFNASLDHRLQREAYHKAQKWVEVFPNVKRGPIFYGPSGRGKSHILKAMGIALLNKPDPVKVFYVSCTQIGMLLKQKSSPLDNEPTLRDKMLSAQVLLLDDLEKGLAGDAPTWTRELVKGVLDAVDSAGKPIVISTSNASPEQHQKALAKQEWLYSRLMRLFHWVEVDGINWRLKEAQETGLLIEIEE